MNLLRTGLTGAVCVIGAMAVTPPDLALAQSAPLVVPSYSDLADLADSANLVALVRVRSITRIKNERSPGLRPGEGRFYARVETRALLFGDRGVGDTLAYLVDLPLDSRGRPPSVKKRDMLIFARTIPARPGELQLIGRNGQVPARPDTTASLRPILAALAARDAPPRITGVREIIHVPGDLAGTGETQVFLSTADGSAASIAVRRQPGREVDWGVSFSELVADAGSKPAPLSLAWYRLACFLPDRLSPGINLSESPMARQQALSDYRMVLGELGPCGRTLDR